MTDGEIPTAGEISTGKYTIMPTPEACTVGMTSMTSHAEMLSTISSQTVRSPYQSGIAQTSVISSVHILHMFIKTSKSHTEQVMNGNFKLILNKMSNGGEYYMSDNGSLLRKNRRQKHLTGCTIFMIMTKVSRGLWRCPTKHY